MRVAIDISPIRGMHQFRGIGIYTKLLVRALQEYDKENEYILTTKTRLANIDLIHYPYFDFYFLTLPFFRLKPSVVTIHDTIPLVYPNQYIPGIRGKNKFRLQKFKLKRVKAIITDSDRSKEDISRYLDIEPDKIHRVYLASNPLIKLQPYSLQRQFRTKYGISKPYFLYVGDINYNKNVPGLIEAFASVSQDFILVLVSRAMNKDIKETRTIRDQINSLGLSDSIRIVTDLPDDPNLLSAAYSGAFWYIQPSFYEGFGFPVLEAMNCGTPVISSIGGSLREVAGEAALLFDPLKANDLPMTMMKVINFTKKQRQVYVDRGKVRTIGFSWEKTARETAAIYQKVMKSQ